MAEHHIPEIDKPLYLYGHGSFTNDEAIAAMEEFCEQPILGVYWKPAECEDWPEEIE